MEPSRASWAREAPPRRPANAKARHAIRTQVLMTHIQTHESVRILLTAFEKATTVRPAVGDRTKQAKLLVPMCKKSSIQKAFSKRDARLLKLADEAKIDRMSAVLTRPA